MGTESLINVAIADDHAIMREGLIRQLATDKAIRVTMEAAHGLDLLKQLNGRAELPDIAIIDLNMPVMDGFSLSVALKEQYPQIRTLVLSAYCSDYNIARMIHNGVAGYLLKDCSPAEFKKAIHSIYETGRYYSLLADEHLFRSLEKGNIKTINIPEREMEFLRACCSEQRYDQIAQNMGISLHTLDGCRERLFERLGIRSRIALVLFAMQSGIGVSESYHPGNIKLKF